jgi:hypothetical protein
MVSLSGEFINETRNRHHPSGINDFGVGNHLSGSDRVAVAVLCYSRPGALFYRDFVAARSQIFSPHRSVPLALAFVAVIAALIDNASWFGFAMWMARLMEVEVAALTGGNING